MRSRGLIVLGLLLAGCASTPEPPGTISGGILLFGGPSPGLNEKDGYHPGTVEVLRDGELVSKGYRFSLPPGRYQLRVLQSCETAVVLAPKQAVKADLRCSIP